MLVCLPTILGATEAAAISIVVILVVVCVTSLGVENP